VGQPGDRDRRERVRRGIRHDPRACAINCYNNNEVYAFHPGGANLLFGDGSVRFARSSMTINTLNRPDHRASGEVVVLDF